MERGQLLMWLPTIYFLPPGWKRFFNRVEERRVWWQVHGGKLRMGHRSHQQLHRPQLAYKGRQQRASHCMNNTRSASHHWYSHTHGTVGLTLSRYFNGCLLANEIPTSPPSLGQVEACQFIMVDDGEWWRIFSLTGIMKLKIIGNMNIYHRTPGCAVWFL